MAFCFLSKMKFFLTRELGRLAKWLRILGFDARYERSNDKSCCVIESLKEERILITRNLRFGRRRGGSVVVIKHDRLQDQLKDLKDAIGLKVDTTRLFTRCTICNMELAGVLKGAVEKEVPEYVYQTNQDFKRCPDCGRIYWHGTHWGNAERLLRKL